MSIHSHNITSSPKNQYHHLTKDDRVKIETLISLKYENDNRIYNNTHIANLLGIHKSIISRELKKRIKSKIFVKTDHIKNLPYSANRAHQDYLFKRALSKAVYIIEKYPKMKKFIQDKILIDGWAPDAIIGFMEKNQFYLKDGFCSISTSTVYRAIHYGLLKVNKFDLLKNF